MKNLKPKYKRILIKLSGEALAGEAGHGPCENQINMAPFASGDHTVELRPLFPVRPGQALVSEDSSQLPFRMGLNFLCVVIPLHFERVEGAVPVAADAAVDGDPQLAVRPFAFHN